MVTLYTLHLLRDEYDEYIVLKSNILAFWHRHPSMVSGQGLDLLVWAQTYEDHCACIDTNSHRRSTAIHQPPHLHCSCSRTKHSLQTPSCLCCSKVSLIPPFIKAARLYIHTAWLKLGTVIEVNTSLWDEGVIAPKAPHGSSFSLPPALSFSLF